MFWLGILDHCLFKVWEDRIEKCVCPRICLCLLGCKLMLIAMRIETQQIKRHSGVEQIGVADPY